MEPGHAKLFIGGISWGTNEERLKEYFSSFGEVVECVIMKDRSSGRARGFGFVVFADLAAAERVVLEKHCIDGWMVEAKWAVPRDELSLSSKSSNSTHSSPSMGYTKKIFVGGLPSTVIENDLKKYFEQFGLINDAIVMYDSTTKRPRGFGFITFDKEDSVDKVLQRTFHELNGKMVEVKRAVPKDLSPSPIQSPIRGYGLTRVSNILSGFNPGYLPGLVGQYGNRIGNGINPFTYGCSEFPPYGPGYGASMTFNPSFTGSAFSNDRTGFGRAMNSYTAVDANRLGYYAKFQMHNRQNSSLFSPMTGNLVGNAGLNYLPSAGVPATFEAGSRNRSLSSPYSAREMANTRYTNGDGSLVIRDPSQSSTVNATRSSTCNLLSGVRGGVHQDSFNSRMSPSGLALGSVSSENDGRDSCNYGFLENRGTFDKTAHGYVGYGDIGIAT